MVEQEVGTRKLDSVQINPIHMVLSVLVHWRVLIVAGIIGAVLLGLANFGEQIQEKKNVQNTSEEYESQKELYTKAVLEYEAAVSRYDSLIEDYDNQINYYQKLIEGKEVYLENSILPQIDPMNENVSSVQLFFVVNPEECQEKGNFLVVDPSDAIVNAYTSLLTSGLNYADIAKKTKLNESYINEIIRLYPDLDSNSLQINVIGANSDFTELVMNEILKQVSEKQKQIVKDVFPHDLKYTEVYSTKLIDTEVPVIVKGYYEDIITLRKGQNTAINNRDSLEEPVEPTEPAMLLIENKGISEKKILKQMILGAIALVILVAGIYGLIYIFSGVIHVGDEIEEQFGIRMISNYRTGWKKNGKIDSWIHRLLGEESLHTEPLGDERLSMYLNSMNLTDKKLLFLGTIPEDEIKDYVTRIRQIDSLTNCNYAGNPYKDNLSLKSLSEDVAIVLVEKKNYSTYKDIMKEIESIKSMEKTIVGYVVL